MVLNANSVTHIVSMIGNHEMALPKAALVNANGVSKGPYIDETHAQCEKNCTHNEPCNSKRKLVIIHKK